MTEPTVDAAAKQRRTIIVLLVVLIAAVLAAVVIFLVVNANAQRQDDIDACRASATNTVDRFLCDS